MRRYLELIEAIRDQKAKYCRYLDTKQFDAWEDLFIKDVRITFYGPEGQVLLDVPSFDEFSRPYSWTLRHNQDYSSGSQF